MTRTGAVRCGRGRRAANLTGGGVVAGTVPSECRELRVLVAARRAAEPVTLGRVLIICRIYTSKEGGCEATSDLASTTCE
jgi:hypothetical protein